MPDEWRQFVMNLENIEAGLVEEVLVDCGAHSVTLTDAGDAPVLEPAPGDTPLWDDTRITALFDANVNVDALKVTLLEKLQRTSLPPNHVETLQDRAWEREWLKDFGPMKFGRRLWILPGNEPAPDNDGIIVRLDPGLAFGTGTHATTAQCLEWLDRIDLRGRTVLDFGCGSGILAIAACKLGAASAEGVDIDLQAVTASLQNAARNNVADRFSAGTALADESAQFDVVIANILAGTLIENATPISHWVKRGGQLALSGILHEQVDAVLQAYRGNIDFEPAAVQDNWACLMGTRR
ncbi:MAG: 50S ribosomal protein L11 methyltransferase [Woeseiaceae bacterium]